MSYPCSRCHCLTKLQCFDCSDYYCDECIVPGRCYLCTKEGTGAGRKSSCAYERLYHTFSCTRCHDDIVACEKHFKLNNDKLGYFSLCLSCKNNQLPDDGFSDELS